MFKKTISPPPLPPLPPVCDDVPSGHDVGSFLSVLKRRCEVGHGVDSHDVRDSAALARDLELRDRRVASDELKVDRGVMVRRRRGLVLIWLSNPLSSTHVSERIQLSVLVVGNKRRGRRLLRYRLGFAAVPAIATAFPAASVKDEALQEHVQELAHARVEERSDGRVQTLLLLVSSSFAGRVALSNSTHIGMDYCHKHVTLARSRDASHALGERTRPGKAARPVLAISVVCKPAPPVE